MIFRRRTLALVSAVAFAAAAGCGGSESLAPQAMPRLVSSDVDRAEPEHTPAADEAAAGMRAFAHRLLADHPELLKDGNGVVSAASIATAFAMLRAGATGQTADQIDRVLGFPSSDLGPAYNFLTDQWRTDGEGDDAPELSVANALFVQDGFTLKDAFLDALARDFGAGVRTVDFAGEAERRINAWVREETRDRIEKLFDDIDPNTRLVLANAIYLKATWASKFSSDATEDDAFERAAGGPVQVPFMHQTSELDYARGDGWSAVRLPYVGDELSMWVLLPDGDGDPVELLDPAILTRATTSAGSKLVDVSLPKWDFQSDMPLTDVLPAMGMPKAFSAMAEFPGIAETSLMIDDVIHRADITVDEEGTEAAAVTGIGMVETALPPNGMATFDADRPFAFAVMHDATGSPLFEGVVGDPSATQ